MASPNIAALPTEVLELVVQHLDTAALKRLRRANKSLCEYITPLLFKTIVLVSFTSCLSGFTKLLSFTSVTVVQEPLARDESRDHVSGVAYDGIARHVRRLVYDDRWHSEFWDYVGELKPSGPESVQDVVERYHDEETVFKNFVGAEREKAGESREVMLMRSVLDLLPGLREVHVLERGASSKDDEAPTWFYIFMKRISSDQDDASDDEHGSERKREFDRCRRERSAVEMLVETKADVLGEIEKFKVSGLEQSMIEPTPCESLTFRELKEVEVTFRMNEPNPFADLNRPVPQYSPLAHALMNVKKLERLVLNGRTPYDSTGAYCEGKETLIPSFVREKIIFDSLRHLSISGTPMNADCLMPLLEAHKSTLKSLELKSIVLISPQRDMKEQCWIRILYLCKSMKLDHFALGYVLANGGNQSFHFDTAYDFSVPSQYTDFVNQRDRWYHTQLTMWGCGHPGVGVAVGKMRYPSIEDSRWFDWNALRAVERWVVDQKDGRPCPLQRFAVAEGDLDYEPDREERGYKWHVYAWNEEKWEFEYRGQRTKDLG
jgi:outer membrane protein assembly factor BamE (lipoprotein component of BamABCDE complex)